MDPHGLADKNPISTQSGGILESDKVRAHSAVGIFRAAAQRNRNSRSQLHVDYGHKVSIISHNITGRVCRAETRTQTLHSDYP